VHDIRINNTTSNDEAYFKADLAFIGVTAFRFLKSGETLGYEYKDGQ